MNLDDFFDNCLYFTVNKLSRSITKMAEESFAKTGLSPTHAFLMMLVIEKPGISQSELAEALHLKPSTITRFVDKLVEKGLIERKTEGKRSLNYPTEKGNEIVTDIKEGWKILFRSYSDILGEEEGKTLNSLINEAGKKLEK
ncbi:DNA-binding MarR family transcriptional regulator [Bacillus tianshenii]|uniref:DNA-binding MarR family transcriptional regulator n=1 Tax=Sutcliffiella tianshenii TaxID=1463404 RepID=A0ABS2P012_9BACI|nr:MarR family transcriptional regulator [Bacillus tianshenii]MBM7619982.1 DNA-binding MarR family transcriptional regulator [Bacillus tianshenii]